MPAGSSGIYSTGTGVSTGAITRAVTAASMANLADNLKMRRAEWAVALDEIDQQARIPFAAEVNDMMIWSDELKVEFAATFVDAPDERTVPYGDPHFTFGVQMDKGFAHVTVLLRRYVRSDDYITAAYIVIGVAIPGAKKKLKVAGNLHLNFQGYGAAQDDTEDTTDTGEIFS